MFDFKLHILKVNYFYEIYHYFFAYLNNLINNNQIFLIK